MTPRKAVSTLYLRGLPEGLVREAKALAARRGITLTAFVAQALERAVGGTGAQRPRTHDLSEDMAWFKKNRARLGAKYTDEYVAIVGQKVIDHDAEFGPLAQRVFGKLGRRPVFMPRCTREERVVQLRSPRVTSR